MTPEEFDALFDGVTRSAFRYEGLPVYDVDEEDADLVAWRNGRPMAERGVDNDPWLARIAVQTAVKGIRWQRVRQTTTPLSWYLAWEVAAYVEARAVGERISLTDQRFYTGQDFWLLDAGTRRARAILQWFDDNGAPVEQQLVTDRTVVGELTQIADRLLTVAQPLNAWIAEHRDELRGAEVRG